ncbi:Caprin-1 [Acipenser ruthenus]|uniref:Caprin-1 n=1 Tax=Acipenser ruthenus TaxID=7906 RepID=A0A662YZ10_ACIRT|nr:Caprin-1 [Acipenser ruthenus]
MPSATISSSMVQAASPELGSVPGSLSMSAQFQSGAQSETIKQVLGVIEKKVRNLEKKKGKLDDYQAKVNGGECLNQDQLEAVSKFQEVVNNLDFARELQKGFLALGQDIQKAVKKAARREQLQREEAEQRRLKAVLELQFMLDKLGEETVRNELKQGLNGTPLLTDDDLTALDEFYKLVGPERDQNLRLSEQYNQATLHYWDLLEAKDKAVAGTTYKALKETLDQVLQSGYFDSAHTHQNGACEEEEQQQLAVAEAPEAEEQPAEPGNDQTVTMTNTTGTSLKRWLFVNRQFMSDAPYSSSDKEQGDEWSTDSEVVGAIRQQSPVQSAPPPVVAAAEPHTLNPVAPTAPADPVVRKLRVQDLMAQMQGPYNFMQDSMLEYESQAMDPAIVSAQPMKTAQSIDMPQMVPMVSPVPEAFTTSQPLYQTSHTTDPHPQTEAMDPIQASMSLASEQPPTSSALPAVSQPQVFQAVSSKPLHSSGINVNAAPFQSMQTVFNMNAPVPPAIEAEALKQPSQYPSSYSQGFNSQTPHQVEQPELQQEQLQSVVGSFHTQDQTIPAAGSHQQLSQQPQQGSGFPRPGQSFYNSRAMSRGGPRNSRGMLNGYRGPSNGFRGGYDNYRPPFSNTPNSGYGQSQFNAPRDYSNSSYQRDGYQQNYKRGAGQGPRGCSRGNAQVMRS